jgi:hypothetical protein
MHEQLRFPAGYEIHEGIRCIVERRPDLEGRLDLEGEVVVVEEDQRRRAGVHEQGVESGAGERRGAPVFHHFDVPREQIRQGVDVLLNGG